LFSSALHKNKFMERAQELRKKRNSDFP